MGDCSAEEGVWWHFYFPYRALVAIQGWSPCPVLGYGLDCHQLHKEDQERERRGGFVDRSKDNIT